MIEWVFAAVWACNPLSQDTLAASQESLPPAFYQR